jgi:hypothetical protein
MDAAVLLVSATGDEGERAFISVGEYGYESGEEFWCHDINFVWAEIDIAAEPPTVTIAGAGPIPVEPWSLRRTVSRQWAEVAVRTGCVGVAETDAELTAERAATMSRPDELLLTCVGVKQPSS